MNNLNIQNNQQNKKDNVIVLGKEYSSKDYIIITTQIGEIQTFVVKKRK